VRWETYERLLAEQESSAPRFTYDRGELEIMSPSPEHERVNRRLAQRILALTEAMGIEAEDLDSPAFRREDLERGFEPDPCFYIENEALIYGKDHVDLSVDPPPDLMIEIDLTSPSISKLPIYAHMGVPEVWRYDGERLTMWKLEGSGYTEIEESHALPYLTSAVVSDFAEKSKTTKRTTWLMTVREWARNRTLPSD
jgi:Uma2 family endonuclease